MPARRIHRALIAALAICLPALAVTAAPVAALQPAALQPALDVSRFASAERRVETIIHVPALGRYSISAKSATGVSLELVDRMSGTIATSGPSATAATSAPGAASTQGTTVRLDAFLEPGEYKVRIAKEPAETVDLTAVPFLSANGGPDAVPVLADGESFDGELHDLQLASWWIQVDAARPSVTLEARGRGLADAALWKDGMWDTGLRPVRRTLEPEPGKPVTVLELNANVEPGLYLLVCAGTRKLAWAKESNAEPFSVSLGARFLGDLGLMKVAIPARGAASFLVSGSVQFVQLEAPNSRGYRLMTSPNASGSSRYDATQQAVIDQKSASLRCAVQGAGGETSWVTIQGPPGETVEVRWFGPSGGESSNGLVGLQPYAATGDYLTSVMSAAEGKDSLDANGAIFQVSQVQNKPTIETLAVQAVKLSLDKPLRRRTNATGTLSFLLQPEKRGTFAVVERDTAVTARYGFSLMDDALASDKVKPVEVKAGGRIDLQAKLYLVTITPIKAGILDFAIIPASLSRAKTADIFSAAAPTAMNDIWWGSTSVVQNNSGAAFLVLGARQSIAQGIQVRQLPLAIEKTAGIRVEPSGRLSLPFTAERDVRIFSTNPAFNRETASIDGAPWRADLVIHRGAHTLVLANRSSQPEWHVIGAAPPDPSVGSPRPQVPEMETLFPSFTEGVPVWSTFERGQSLSFLLKVKEAGSYRVSTAGRLAMEITIRTFLRPSLASTAQNADGRNAVLSVYLRPGVYLVKATAQGASRGRAGVMLEPVLVAQTAPLRQGSTIRATVPGAAVMQTDVRIDSEGDYALECLGLGRGFPWRLEDAGGWPVGDPIRTGALSGRLGPGLYRYLSMPDDVETRRLVSLQSLAPADPYDPKAKQVALQLNRTMEKTWVEQPGRPDDVFTVDLPAEVHAVLSLSKGMRFIAKGPAGSAGYQGVGGENQDLVLGKGSWRIEVGSLDEDNLKSYQVTLTTEDMYVGSSRRVAATSGTIPVSVGSAGTAEIWSYGPNELEAALVDEAGNLVAVGQTIQDDWNFRVVTGVTPGRYRLFYYSPLAAQAGGATPTPSTVEPDDEEGGDEEYVSEDDAEYDDTEYEESTDDESEYEESEYDEAESEEYVDDESAYDESETEEDPVIAPATPSLEQGAAVIRMIVREEIALPAASGSLDAKIDLAEEVAVVPFTSRESAVYRVSGSSTSALSVAVLRDGKLLASAPSPLFLPLAAGGVYSLRYWRTSDEKTEVAVHAGAEASFPLSSAGAADARAPVLRLSFPAGTSFDLDANGGSSDLLFSGGTDLPFTPLADAAVSTAAGTGWAMRADAGPIGPFRVTPVAIAGASARAIAVGAFEGGFDIQVPARSVALLKTDNAGAPVGLSVSPRGASRPDAYDWRAGRVDSRSSVLGLREGEFKGRIWETQSPTQDLSRAAHSPSARRIVVSAMVYPIASESNRAGDDISLVVAPGSAIVLGVGGAGAAAGTASAAGTRKAVSVSLERGMAAFAWQNGPVGIVDATDGATTGSLDTSRGSLVIVNQGKAPGMCVIRGAAAPVAAEIAEGPGFESLLRAEASVSFNVRSSAASSLFVWGSFTQARYLGEADGRISLGESVKSEVDGLVRFPPGRGRLEIVSAGGPLKVWSAPAASYREPFVQRDRTGDTVLPPQGGVLMQGAQSWSFSLDAQSIVLVKADGDGVAGLYDRSGSCLRAAAGIAGRTIVTLLPKGTYSVFTRPFRGSSAAAGLITMKVLAARDLAKDGPGEATLIGPQDTALYRFRVLQEGTVGCGIQVQSDGLSASLLDESFGSLGTGQIFRRTLKPGLYYLLVSGTEGTQRFTPVVYGLAGNNADIPDDIIRAYRGE